MSTLMIKRKVHFRRGLRGSLKLADGPKPEPLPDAGIVPRISRLMAFAVVFDEWLASGKVADYADLACLTGLDPSRITQIMNLRLLSPREQERLLETQDA